jgi:hypothetical protein
MSSFQLVGIPYERFAPLFELPDEHLARLDARRVIATSNRGFPCRVSLTDALAGEELLLLPYEHQGERSPYRASGPIFVRRGAVRAVMAPGVLPDYVRTRLISVRAYDAEHMMVDAAVSPGEESEAVIRRMLSTPRVEYIHLHNANRGCFSCVVNRA